MREVIDGDGAIHRQETVFCPILGRSLPLEECLACPDFQGLDVDPTEGACINCVGALSELRALVDAGRTTAADSEDELDDDGEPTYPASTVRALAAPGDHTPVREIMTQRVICVRPEVRRFELEALFLERGISGCPVVDESGLPIGIVSKTDLLGQRHFGALGATTTPTAAELMTPVAFSVHEGTSVAQAAALMAYEGIHRLPVVANDGSVVGLISPLDVLGWVAREHGYVVPG
jgi:CBS domain-containing protein